MFYSSNPYITDWASLSLRYSLLNVSPYRQLNDANALKARLTKENFDLQHSNQELDSANAALAKARQQLQLALDDLKRQLDDESRVHITNNKIYNAYTHYISCKRKY